IGALDLERAPGGTYRRLHAVRAGLSAAGAVVGRDAAPQRTAWHDRAIDRLGRRAAARGGAGASRRRSCDYGRYARRWPRPHELRQAPAYRRRVATNQSVRSDYSAGAAVSRDRRKRAQSQGATTTPRMPTHNAVGVPKSRPSSRVPIHPPANESSAPVASVASQPIAPPTPRAEKPSRAPCANRPKMTPRSIQKSESCSIAPDPFRTKLN